MSLSLADMLRVRIRAQQPLQFFGVLDLHLDHPTVAVRIAVHERRVLLQRLVGLDNRARYRGIQLRHGLHGLDGPEDRALAERRGGLGNLDQDNVTKLTLGALCDAPLANLWLVPS